jgi:hypothetical protein
MAPHVLLCGYLLFRVKTAYICRGKVVFWVMRPVTPMAGAKVKENPTFIFSVRITALYATKS